MNLPTDISGLIFTYNVKPGLASWVELSDILHNDRSILDVPYPSFVRNPGATDFIIKNLLDIIPSLKYKETSGNPSNGYSRPYIEPPYADPRSRYPMPQPMPQPMPFLRVPDTDIPRIPRSRTLYSDQLRQGLTATVQYPPGPAVPFRRPPPEIEPMYADFSGFGDTGAPFAPFAPLGSDEINNMFNPYNPYGMQQLPRNNSIKRPMSRIDYFSLLQAIASTPSPNVAQLIEKVLTYGKIDPEPTHEYIKDLTTNPYGYSWALDKFPELLALQNQQILVNLLGLKNQIPDLIAIYKSKRRLNDWEAKLLAAHPFMFDIFLDKIGYPDKNIREYSQMISSNPSELAMMFLTANPDLIDTSIILENPSAYDFISRALITSNYKLSESDASRLCRNPNPRVIQLLRTHLELVQPSLSANPSEEAISILMENPDLIWISNIIKNTNPRVIPLLKAKYKELDKKALALNPVIFQQSKLNAKFVDSMVRFIKFQIKKLIEKKQKELIELINTLG